MVIQGYDSAYCVKFEIGSSILDRNQIIGASVSSILFQTWHPNSVVTPPTRLAYTFQSFEYDRSVKS